MRGKTGQGENGHGAANAAKPTPCSGSGTTKIAQGRPSGAIEPCTAMSALREAAEEERGYALWAVIPDTHLPYHDPCPIDAIEQYAEDERWDGWIHLGDLLDNESISDFSRDFPRKRMSAPTVKEQFASANLWLDRHLSAFAKQNPGLRQVLIEGNHEFRTEKYVDRNPELSGLMDVEDQLHLRARKIEYVRFWSRGDLYRIGKLYLGHGVYTVQNHANKHVREYGCNLLYGHCHDVQASYIRRRGSNHPLMAQSIGCLCRYDQLYMRGRPMNWMHAFAVVAAFPDGTFQHAVVPIINGRFVGPTNGKVYKGRK